MARPLKCLWIAREIPFPRNTGDRIYSGKLAEAFSDAGGLVTYLGLRTDGDPDANASLVNWLGVPGKKKSNVIAFFSRLPLVAAAHSNSAIRLILEKELGREWDLIVLDHYGSAWALESVLETVYQFRGRVLLVYVSHNHEENLAQALWRASPKYTLRTLALLLNLFKIRYWERKLTTVTQLVTAITDEDGVAYMQRSKIPRYLTLTPGHSGKEAPPREIGPATPRNVVIIGSYRWGVKEQNLRGLLLEADTAFFKNGITLHVVGDVTETLRMEFKGKLQSTVLHGYVPDFEPFLSSSRVALVPEVIGGGFKLKFLDYFFGRIPVATIEEASAGLPTELRNQILRCADLRSLVNCVVDNIDNFALLNSLQENAFKVASNQFAWIDRGKALMGTLEGLRALQ